MTMKSEIEQWAQSRADDAGRLAREFLTLHAEIDRLRKERDEARAQAFEAAAIAGFISSKMGMTSEQIAAAIRALKEKQG